VTARRRRTVLIGAAAVVVLILVGGRFAALETAERAWAATVRGGDIYLQGRNLARLVGALILLISVAWGVTNLYLVYRTIGSVQMPRHVGDLEIVEAVPQPVLLAVTVVSGVFFGVVLAWGTGDWWLKASLSAAPPVYGVLDPVLHQDLGYYVGVLPWESTRQGFMELAVIAALAVVALLYAGIGSLRIREGRIHASPPARTHVGLLLAGLAALVFWGALLDPAEVVGGLHGAIDRGALAIRLPGARLVAVFAVLAAGVSLVWTVREASRALFAAWGALIVAAAAVYVIVPPLFRDPRGGARVDPAERASLAALAYGTVWDTAAPALELPTLAQAVSTLPVWDPVHIAAALTAGHLVPEGVAVTGVALRPADASEARITWLAGLGPDTAALARDTGVTWDSLHRGRWSHAGPALLAEESDSNLDVLGVPGSGDTWFGPAFETFALVPAASSRARAIPLSGGWRRLALAWALQSPELTRDETDGLALLWRRDPAGRLARLAPFADFDPPLPVTDAGATWWVAYGYTSTESFPLAPSASWRGRTVRGLRAGLIGAVNATTGDTRLWYAPGYDSLTAAWGRFFQPLVAPEEEIPPAIRRGLAFPAATFSRAADAVSATASDSAGWGRRPREPFQFLAPSGAAPGRGGAGGVWTAQGFTAGTPPRLAGLLAATMTPAGPRATFWRPAVPDTLPGEVFGSGATTPGLERLWVAAGRIFSLEGVFAAPADSAPPRLERVYLAWGDRIGDGASPARALAALTNAPVAAGDTTLAGRWAEAQRLARQADAALAAGDLAKFGELYRALRDVLAGGRGKLAPPPRPH